MALTLRDLLGYVTVKDAVLVSSLGGLAYHAYLLHSALKATAHKHDSNSFTSVRSETVHSDESDGSLRFGFQG